MSSKSHFLLISVGTLGDTLPFIGLGRELRARGHRATFLGSGAFRALAEEHGIEFGELISVAEHRRETEQRLRWGNAWIAAHEGGRNLLRDVPTTFRAIEQRWEQGRTVVVATGLMFGARIAQEKLGVPLATMHLQPACFRSERDSFQWPNWVPQWFIRTSHWVADVAVDQTLGREINHFRATLNLPPVRRIVPDWWQSPQLTIGAFPSFLAPTRRHWPAAIKFAGFPAFRGSTKFAEAERLAEYLAQHAPPVVFSPTSAVRNVSGFLKVAVSTAERLAQPAILLTPHEEFVPPTLPAKVAHFRFVPHEQIFPRAAAVVHNGGIGTVAACLSAGVPQLVVPCILDQFDNAKRLQRLGVAEVVSQRRFQPAHSARVLKHLLDSPEVARKCGTYAERCRSTHALAEIADAVEKLLPA